MTSKKKKNILLKTIGKDFYNKKELLEPKYSSKEFRFAENKKERNHIYKFLTSIKGKNLPFKTNKKFNFNQKPFMTQTNSKITNTFTF